MRCGEGGGKRVCRGKSASGCACNGAEIAPKCLDVAAMRLGIYERGCMCCCWSSGKWDGQWKGRRRKVKLAGAVALRLFIVRMRRQGRFCARQKTTQVATQTGALRFECDRRSKAEQDSLRLNKRRFCRSPSPSFVQASPSPPSPPLPRQLLSHLTLTASLAAQPATNTPRRGTSRYDTAQQQSWYCVVFYAAPSRWVC